MSSEHENGPLEVTQDVAGQSPRPPAPDGIGSSIGPYKLLQQIGEGGMGSVFMAEQTEPVIRRVALKVIKPGMDSKQVIARFEAERQALAMMDHHHIARVLDAGTTVNGRPYFVMELVRGIPITDYCDQVKLATRPRLDLFISVCEAIQHAHQKGIIHRDIKPSNVLVTLHDGKPVPKVIDFGVAKATERRLTDKTMFTEFGQAIGTLEYMSPEQAEMSGLDIDTRSDVYSLGVLLYVLLTGSTPIRKQQFQNAGIAQLVKTIQEFEPPKPSTRLNESEMLPELCAQRGTEPRKLGALLQGDLDWIVMKALEKDRSRRYGSASDLARDVARYLNDEAVEACPPSTAYRVRKWLRRNRGLAAAATGMAAVAMGVTIAAVLAAGVYREQRNQILAEQAKTQKQQAKAQQIEVQRKENLLQALAIASPGGVPQIVAQLDPSQLERLQRLHDQSTDRRARLRYQIALSLLGDDRHAAILDVLAAAPATESYNIFLALKASRQPALAALRKQYQAARPIALKARCAILLLELGDASAARQQLELGPDLSQRTEFIHVFARWHGDLRNTLRTLESSDNGPFRSGLCLALGSVPESSIARATDARIDDLLREIYVRDPEGAVHSAARWALDARGVALPELPQSRDPPPGQSWFVNQLGMTMIRIPNGLFHKRDYSETDGLTRPSLTNIITRPFFVHDEAISVRLYRQFLAAYEPSENNGMRLDGVREAELDLYDVARVPKKDAMLFCNWLSRRADRRPCYPVDEPQKMGQAIDPRADGYRLLTEAEWEHAFRCGTRTKYVTGAVPARILDYGALSGTPLPGRSMKPSPWGLFDMPGNHWEMTWAGYRTVVGVNINRFDFQSVAHPVRGGSYHGGLFYLGGSVRLPGAMRNRIYAFRVALGTLGPQEGEPAIAEALQVLDAPTTRTYTNEETAAHVRRQLLVARGRDRLRRGQWSPARDDFSRAVDCGPLDPASAVDLASRLLLVGGQEAYGKLVARLQGRGWSARDASTVCLACLLLPGVASHDQLPIQVLVDDLTSSEAAWHPWGYRTAALIAYRQQRYEQALVWAEKIKPGDPAAIRVIASAIQALVHRARGDEAKAEAALAEVTALLPSRLQRIGGADFRTAEPLPVSADHRVWYMAEILRREASGQPQATAASL